jgi:PiT family inorganic phosphate transporter
MSEVADSGAAIKVKRNPPPTRRQRAAAREEARRRAAAEKAATLPGPNPSDTKKGPQR